MIRIEFWKKRISKEAGGKTAALQEERKHILKKVVGIPAIFLFLKLFTCDIFLAAQRSSAQRFAAKRSYFNI
jgi:hypothetical protein